MFFDIGYTRRIAAMLILTVGNLSLHPVTVAAQVAPASSLQAALAKSRQHDELANLTRAMRSKSAFIANRPFEQRFSSVIADIHSTTRPGKRGAPLSTGMRHIRPPSGELKGQLAELRSMYAQAENELVSTGKDLGRNGASSHVLQRHQKMVEEYGLRKAKFEKLALRVSVAGADSPESASARKELHELIASFGAGRGHQRLDVNKLSHRSPFKKVRPAMTSLREFQASVFPPSFDGIQLASADISTLQLSPNALSTIPEASDTAETVDVQITPAVNALATKLHHSPVEIFNWVRNNIAFTPTYGSIQGSELTLQNRRGNSFDTASLLIALYRSAGIPSRYVYGTVEVPADQVMNWVGGVATPAAAQEMLGQGGIPNTGVTGGGQIKSFRLEHVWVEAFVSYGPARGAIRGAADHWVPVDAAFKQFDYAPAPENVFGDFDPTAFRESALQGTVVSSDGASVAGMDATAINSEIEDLHRRLLNWSAAVAPAHAAATLRRKQSVRSLAPSFLLGTLPYKLLVKAATFRAVPSSMRWELAVAYFATQADVSYGNSLFETSLPLSKISDKKLGLSFVPASAGDASTIAGLKAAGATALPAYAIQAVAQLTLDDQVLIAAPPSMLGSRRIASVTVRAPFKEDETDYYDVTLGDEAVLSLNAAGVGDELIENRTAKKPSTTASENMHSVGMLYWFLSDLGNEVLAASLSVTQVRLPSIGRKRDASTVST